jgi:hypothetical protein
MGCGIRSLVLGIAAAALIAPAATADCFTYQSRSPVAGAAPPKFRAAMLRVDGPKKTPSARPARPKAARPKAARPTATTVRKAKATRNRPSVRKASAPRPARKAGTQRAVVLPPKPWGLTAPGPTPFPIAQREIDTPESVILITTTICESGPVLPPSPELLETPPPETEAPPFQVFPPGGEPPFDDEGGVTVFPPPVLPPPFVDEGDVTVVVFPPPEQPPVFPPTVFPPPGPPVGPPTVTPPQTPPDTPPVTPPPGPPPVPPVGPPVGPPPITPAEPPGPPVTPIPEPSTWALMILGFGLAGAGLRRRRLSVS